MESPEANNESKLPGCRLHPNKKPTFYIGRGNGASLVEAFLTNLGWKRTTDKYDLQFKIRWVQLKNQINYDDFREGEQLVNHIPNSNLLTNKLGLLNSLREYERVTLTTKGRLPRLKMSEFHPETYKLDEKSDRNLFLEVYKEGEIWICKPIGWNQGKGIFLLRSREAIDTLLKERERIKLASKKPERCLVKRIVQRYIMNPLLLDGKKFDVRAYMLIASTTPFLVLFHKGYVRLSCHEYDQNDMNMTTHLTNQYIQKKDPTYDEVKQETAWSMDKFNNYVNEYIRPKSHVEFEQDWVYNTFTKQMQKIMIHCFNSVKHKLHSRHGFFDLLGLDFMVDTDMKVWLIEVNTNPALQCNCEALEEVIPGAVEESLYVAIECFEKTKKKLPLMPLQSLKHSTILYCGSIPNRALSGQSSSLSPVKDSSKIAIEKPKQVLTAITSKPSHRLLTRNSSMFSDSKQRQNILKHCYLTFAPRCNSETHISTKSSISSARSKTILPAVVTRTDDTTSRTGQEAAKTDTNVAEIDDTIVTTEINATTTEPTKANSGKTGVKPLRFEIIARKKVESVTPGRSQRRQREHLHRGN